MERIDVKLFRANNKYKVVNGVLEKLGLKDTLEGKEIEFLNIKNDDILNLNEFEDIVTMYYKLIPVLTNVDMTISLEELREIESNRTIIFDDFLTAFDKNLKDILVSKHQGLQVKKDIATFLQENGIDTETLKELEQQKQEVKRTKEDIEKEIQDLYENMKTDKQHRTEFLERIDILEKELAEMSE